MKKAMRLKTAATILLMRGSITIRPALADDHVAIEELFKATSMGSRIRIGFERDPDYFAGARVQAEEPCVWGAFDDTNRAIGLFSAGTRGVWLGREMRMRYLCDLRIHPDWRGSSLLARGFQQLRNAVLQPGEWAQTLVLEDNPAALDLLTSRRGGLPEYRPAGKYVSWLLPRQRITASRHIKVRRAGAGNLDEMQALLDAASRLRSFSLMTRLCELGGPAWRDLEASDFLVAEQQGSIIGMMGLWDQSGFQRMRIRGYSPMVAAVRPLWNVFGTVRLPGPGQLVPLRKATAVACRNDDPEILRALLASALSQNDGRHILLGMSALDPLATGMAGLKAKKATGRHFLVGWDGEPPVWQEPFSFDVARI